MAKTMTNRYAGRCVECGSWCPKGTATYFGGYGVTCDSCNGFEPAGRRVVEAAAPVTPVAPVAPVLSAEEKAAAELTSKIKSLESVIETNKSSLNREIAAGRGEGPFADSIRRSIAKQEGELAALKPAPVEVVEVVETVEVVEAVEAVEVVEAAIEIVSEPVTTLELYRHTVRCTVCRMRTNSKATSIRHYTDCAVAEQTTDLLETLRDAQMIASAKRKSTRLAKAEAALEAAQQAVEQMTRKIGGSLLGIHKVYGSTGIHTVRSAEGTCTCPGHKRHGHCKHVAQVRETKEQIAATRKEIARLSTWIIAQVERATEANCEW
jgi:hypothetical protein